MELTEQEIKWIEDHKNDDLNRLRLKYHGDERLMYCITQIDCRRRCRTKLPFLDSSKGFIFPTEIAAEQSTSQYIAKWHSLLVETGASVLDMTCGLGIDAFTISRRAKSVTAIEIDSLKAECAIANTKTLGLANLKIVNADSVDFVEKIVVKDGVKPFDVVFIDPARRDKAGHRLYSLSDCLPDISNAFDAVGKVAHKMIVKASPMLDISHTIIDLRNKVTDIYLVGTPQECKELVAIVDFRKEHINEEEVKIHAVTLTQHGNIVNEFSFTKSEEISSISKIATDITPGKFLCEPWPATMKAAPFDLLSNTFDITKLHPHTHLYLSDRVISDFPGDIYAIEEIHDFSKNSRRIISKNHPHINVAVRNLGVTADELRSKLKVKDGGDVDRKLFGVTFGIDVRRMLIVARKVEALSGTSS